MINYFNFGKTIICSSAVLFSTTLYAQNNDSNNTISPANPFSNYIGVWKLKNGEFKITSMDNIETVLDMPEHTTTCDEINTDKTLLCTIRAKGLAGHVLWSYDSTNNKMHHLSHFGSIGQQLNAIGMGQISPNGDIQTNVHFENQLEGYYNTYEYRWVSTHEYTMRSREFDSKGSPTGAHYSANYIRQ